MLERAGVAPERRRFERSVDARYARQSHELLVPVPPRPIDAAALERDRARRSTIVTCRPMATTIAASRCRSSAFASPRSARSRRWSIRDTPAPSGTDAVKSKRQVWFRETGAVDAAIYDRRRMPAGLEVAGPAVIESLESTILVPPGWQARMNEDGFVLLRA